MKDIFMPYYINTETVKSMFKILVNRYTDIDIRSLREDVTIQAALPLSELTCGKILQGNANVSVTRSRLKSEIEINDNSIIDIYVNLENMLHKHNIVKSLTTNSELQSLSPGDIVEFDCIIDKADSSLEYLNTSKSLLEVQQLTEDIDNSKLISWIDKNIVDIKENKPLKFCTTPLFDGNIIGLLSLCSKNFMSDMECYLGREVTVVGEVTSHSSLNSNKTISSEDYLSVTLLRNILNDNEKYASIMPQLTAVISEKTEKSDSKFIEIVPFIIYL